jgi:hypothetical protein
MTRKLALAVSLVLASLLLTACGHRRAASTTAEQGTTASVAPAPAPPPAPTAAPAPPPPPPASAQAAPPAPEPERTAQRLPRTASPYPLIALAGVGLVGFGLELSRKG